MELVTLAERPDLAEALGNPDLMPEPELLYHDAVAAQCWPRLVTDFPDYQVALLDQGRVIAKGHSIPFQWDGTDAELPDQGWDFVLATGVADRDAGRMPNAASALQIVVAKDRLGTGLSQLMVRSLRDVAAAHALPVLYAPVRPNRKDRYPLIPMEHYARWTLKDGTEPFDPWLRVHWRLGGRILHCCQESMMISGAVAEWEEWTGLAMPASGQYVVPGGLVPVEVDHPRDIGRYIEPNVWVRHDLGDGPAE
ncbi:hypothetical protein [Kribbella shirazensis]|uniref:N-acetyltransferase n=1 Tax=Kribbella shirazensis TaxID=1105143 RepID=A0A7X6A1T9_9ACTN|nr:hypothetical protein [Kribbella shirazensis]NIK58190.1 hypothetical protein [Kribbella shirazensis]